MDLLTDKNRFIKKMAFLKPRQKTFTTIAVLIFILSAWLLFIHTHLKSKIKQNKNIFSQKTKNLNLLKSHKIKCRELEKKIKNIKEDINKNTYKNFKNINQYNINDMIAYAKSSGVSLKLYSTLEEKTDKYLINQHKVSYEFICDLDKALIFCNKLKRSKKNNRVPRAKNIDF